MSLPPGERLLRVRGRDDKEHSGGGSEKNDGTAAKAAGGGRSQRANGVNGKHVKKGAASLGNGFPGRRNARRGAGRSDRWNRVYGALDLGTNNCRLLVARPSRRGFMVIDAFSRIIRLGEGVTHSGLLSPPAMDRTIEALKVCSEKMVRRGVDRSHLIATEACRIARNGPEFVERVRRETGLKLEIISRETEARLAVSGCASLLDWDSDVALVFDIGGGSSELVLLDLRQRKGNRAPTIYDRVAVQDCIVAWTSLPVGVVTLAERYTDKPMDHDTFERMVGDVIKELEIFEAEHNISARIGDAKSHLLGTSGTATTIAGVHLGLEYYDRRRVDGCWMSSKEVRSVSQHLTAMTHEERVREPCIGVERADLIIAGAAILEALLRSWSFDRLRVADRGLREGILAKLMAEDGVHEAQRRRGRHRR